MSFEYRVVVLAAGNLGRAATLGSNEIKSFHVLPRTQSSPRLSIAREAFPVIKNNAGPAADAPVDKTTNGEGFKRFSPYENDRRVTPDKRLLPGSYATTEEDAKNVRTGMDAVRRYALPDSKPASCRFTISPNTNTDVQRGTVASANGQPGGGAEVIFTKGTQPTAVSGPDKLPDE